MPFTASSGSFGCPPRDALNLDARYVVQVATIREKKMPSYDDHEVMVDKAIWSFAVHRAKFDGDGLLLATTPVINAEGGQYVLDAITGVNVSPSKAGKPVAKARTYAEAVLGRDPKTAVDAGEDLMAVLTGRYAMCLFDTKARTDGGTDLVILKISPIQDQQKVAGVVAEGLALASLEAAPRVVVPAAAAAPTSLPW